MIPAVTGETTVHYSILDVLVRGRAVLGPTTQSESFAGLCVSEKIFLTLRFMIWIRASQFFSLSWHLSPCMAFLTSDKAAFSLLILLLLQYGRASRWPTDPKKRLFPQNAGAAATSCPAPADIYLLLCVIFMNVFRAFIHCVLCGVAAHILAVFSFMKRSLHSLLEGTAPRTKCQMRFFSPFHSGGFQRIGRNHIKQL